MSTITGINSTPDIASTYNTYAAASKTGTTDTTAKETVEAGVVYEKSTEDAVTKKSTITQNAEIIAQLKADAEQRTAQLQAIVEKLISGQGNAYGQATDMWQFLASGDYTVDAATKAQAQADIAEDGYWGVAQTSDRILDFAKALSGNDPSKIEELKSAFEKGFKDATHAWGKDLPSISSDTYDAVMSKFDEWANEAQTATE